ncbi:SpoIIE family protein phosphatase [Tumidithrix elongata RA019]|uniref:SpoIIE family protein phosphatase n=1 Tax=Tumidithrix elongata BACA0141 TaxID=2716417 RepID=A0AAW9PZB7_9CYAN|nr:SpoIIE family protein phosphatase [Tumidithrix elongata RA019]
MSSLTLWLLGAIAGLIALLAMALYLGDRERRRLQDTLRQSEATSKALMSAMPDLLIRMKGDGTYLGIVSSDRLSVLNPELSSAGDVSIYDILQPDIAEQRMYHIRKALQMGEMQIYEQQIDIDGQIQHEEVRIVITGDNEVLNIIRDITDRKQAEEALRHNEERLRSLISNIPGAIYRCKINAVWLVDFISNSILDIAGYPAEDFIENRVRTLESIIDPDDREILMQTIHEALAKQQPYQVEYRISHQNGSTRWVQERGKGIFDTNGKPLYLDGAMFDITEQKQAEAIAAMNEQLKTENLRMGAELNIARQIQQMILPKPEELAIEGLDIAGYMEPADEVGGDYYDVLNTDGVVTISIGDVTGHGLESGLLMLMAQTAVRTLKEVREEDPVRFLSTLNRAIYKNVQRMDCNKNLSLLVLNYIDGKISISGQHEEMLVVRKNGAVERVDTIDLGFPIGLDDDIANFINLAIIELNFGDGVVLYTDGIPEAIDIQKKQYGIERLCRQVSENWHRSADEIKQAVIDDVSCHIGSQKVFDDITLLILKRL